jgi:hypothetical protein
MRCGGLDPAKPMSQVARTAAVLVAFWIIVSSPATFAADWSANARFSQSLQADDNRALSINPAGETYESVSRIMLGTVARSPGLRFEADADLSYQGLWGPGADANNAPMDNGVRLKAERSADPLTKYYLLGSWRRQDAIAAQAADDGLILAKGDISTYVVDAGLARQVTRLDAITWSIKGTAVDFTSPTPSASSYVDLTASTGWMRRLNPTTDLITSFQFEWLTREAPSNTQTLFGRAMVGLNSKLSKQLELSGAMGVGVVRTELDGVPSPGGPQSSGTDANWLADVKFVYRPAISTEVWLLAAQSMSPSAVGEVQSRTTVGTGIRHEINHSSYVVAAGAYNYQTSLDSLAYDRADYFRGSVTYGYRLTPEWQAQLAYRYAERVDDTGVARSNSVFLSAVYDTVILP